MAADVGADDMRLLLYGTGQEQGREQMRPAMIILNTGLAGDVAVASMVGSMDQGYGSEPEIWIQRVWGYGSNCMPRPDPPQGLDEPRTVMEAGMDSPPSLHIQEHPATK